MKKVMFLILFSIVLFSCSDKEEPVVTSYQVFNNTSYYSSSVPYLDGSLYEVVVFCYAGSDVVREDSYEKIAPGSKSPVKEVPSSVTKIKVSYKYLPPASTVYSTAKRNYLVSFTLMEPGKNVIAELNDESMVSNSMTIKQQIKTISK